MNKKSPSAWSYLLWRALCVMALVYSLSFIADLSMPLQNSVENLVSRKHQKHKWHYWITRNFRSPVSEEMYNSFPTGEPVHIQHTQLYNTVFSISYTDANQGSLTWERSKLYYFIVLLPLFIAFSSCVALSNRWDKNIGLIAGVSAIIFSGVLMFTRQF